MTEYFVISLIYVVNDKVNSTKASKKRNSPLSLGALKKKNWIGSNHSSFSCMGITVIPGEIEDSVYAQFFG